MPEKLEIPVWALTADDWATLLHASEKTQVPILKRAIDIARNFFDPQNKNNDVKNHILASTLLGIINSSDTSPSKSDKIKGILSTFGTKEINIDAIIDGSMKLREAISISYGNFINQESAINFSRSIYDQILLIQFLSRMWSHIR